MMNNSVGFVVCVLLLLSLNTIISCSPKPEERIKAFEKAYNNHDVEKIMSFYAEDVVHELPGQFVLKGKEELRGLAEYDKVLNMQLSFKKYRVKGDTVTCEFVVTDDWIKTAGIEEVDYFTKFVFSKGLIIQWIAEPTPETAQTLGQVFSSIVEWASKERQQQLKEMAPEGKFIYNAANAKKSLALLKEWKETTQHK